MVYKLSLRAKRMHHSLTLSRSDARSFERKSSHYNYLVILRNIFLNVTYLMNKFIKNFLVNIDNDVKWQA